MRRRDFLKQASSALLILGSGDILSFAGYPDAIAGKTILRFAVASDGHYGQKVFFNRCRAYQPEPP
jgi:hypothetical protein